MTRTGELPASVNAAQSELSARSARKMSGKLVLVLADEYAVQSAAIRLLNDVTLSWLTLSCQNSYKIAVLCTHSTFESRMIGRSP